MFTGLRRFEIAVFLFSMIILGQSSPNNQTTTTFAFLPPQPSARRDEAALSSERPEDFDHVCFARVRGRFSLPRPYIKAGRTKLAVSSSVVGETELAVTVSSSVVRETELAVTVNSSVVGETELAVTVSSSVGQ